MEPKFSAESNGICIESRKRFMCLCLPTENGASAQHPGRPLHRLSRSSGIPRDAAFPDHKDTVISEAVLALVVQCSNSFRKKKSVTNSFRICETEHLRGYPGGEGAGGNSCSRVLLWHQLWNGFWAWSQGKDRSFRTRRKGAGAEMEIPE